MPSLKCMFFDKWLHKGQISQEEYDAVIKKLDGHNKQVREDAFADCILENGEYCWQECCETEHCKECKWLGNGDTTWFEQMQKGAEE